MAFSRPEIFEFEPAAPSLDDALVSLGFALGVRPTTGLDADIELSLVRASIAGMVDDDLRVLAVLTSWLEIHHTYVHVARLRRVLDTVASERVHAYWAAVAYWLKGDRRFGAIKSSRAGRPMELLRVGNEFQVERRGLDPRFESSDLIVPAGVLRDRAADVLSPSALASRHVGYRNRVQIGANWRADVWTVMESDPRVTASEAARRAGCSFAVAWAVRRDYLIWANSRSAAALPAK